MISLWYGSILMLYCSVSIELYFYLLWKKIELKIKKIDKSMSFFFYPLCCRKTMRLVLLSCWKGAVSPSVRKGDGWNFLWIPGVRCMCKWQVPGKISPKQDSMCCSDTMGHWEASSHGETLWPENQEDWVVQT